MIEGSNHSIARTRREAGFSLAEVLVAVALLAVILLALFGLVSAGVRRAYGGKKMTQATMIAQAVMEQANVYESYELLGETATDTAATVTWTRTTSGTTATTGTGPAEWQTMLQNADLPVTPGATLNVNITPLPAGTFANAAMVRIVVDLTWFELGTRRRQVRLQALHLPKEP